MSITTTAARAVQIAEAIAAAWPSLGARVTISGAELYPRQAQTVHTVIDLTARTITHGLDLSGIDSIEGPWGPSYPEQAMGRIIQTRQREVKASVNGWNLVTYERQPVGVEQ